VIFGFSGQKLHILIIKYRETGLYALPGGFIKNEEDLNAAARRNLCERTGLDNIFLEQFHTFGDVQRYQPEIMQAIMAANGLTTPADHWMLDRFISVAYYALINYEFVTPRPDALSDSCVWYPIDELPGLMLDHQVIVDKALETLRERWDKKLMGMNLLPAKFTMKELQEVYEAIMGEAIRRTTFQRKMLRLDILERHEKQYSGKAHKAPFLYSFKVGDGRGVLEI
jgi:ADP-ribose pyrophosphatase YjhB (NUDIX family)